MFMVAKYKVFLVLQNLIVIKMLYIYNRRKDYGLCSMKWSFLALNKFHFNILIFFLMMLNMISYSPNGHFYANRLKGKWSRFPRKINHIHEMKQCNLKRWISKIWLKTHIYIECANFCYAYKACISHSLRKWICLSWRKFRA